MEWLITQLTNYEHSFTQFFNKFEKNHINLSNARTTIVYELNGVIQSCESSEEKECPETVCNFCLLF